MEGKKQLFGVLMALILLLALPSLSSASEFAAQTVGDYGNVTVMEVSGNYDANNPDGSINADPRQQIAKEFYRLHKDEYDFLVIFSNFDVKMPEADARAFYLHVKNDTRGIGQQLFDNSALFGSNGKLQGTIDMGNISALTTDPLDPNFETPLDILSHELMHRWGAYVKFMTAQGMVSNALLGKDLSHWSFLLNSYASLLYGNQWQDNGNNTFTSVADRNYYSPLDLYLMGFVDKTQVPPMLLIDNPDIDPKQMPETGITITGTPTYVTIDDIIAAEGERIPGPAESQKSFKTAFIFITAPGTFIGDELFGIENVRNGWITRYSVLSDGKGIMDVAVLPQEDIPTKPGTTPPPVTPRPLLPNMEDGVTWLMNNQMTEGNWLDTAETTVRDTAEAAYCLRNFGSAQQNYNLGLQWLNGTVPDNTDYLARKIEVIAQAGQDVTPLLQTLILQQNPDGGWGSNKEYLSSAVDTALVLKAFSTAGYNDQSVIGQGIAYLKAKQNPDHAWGADKVSDIRSTARVISALNAHKVSYQTGDNIAQAVAWLAGKQNPDGGFGNSPSTIYDTALTLLMLGAVDISGDVMGRALQYILASQSGDGSWNESPYQTALAIEAVWMSTVAPDLSIKNTDIMFIPTALSSLPSNIVINAVIWNTGRTAVPAGKVALYEDVIAETHKIGEQAVAFPGQSSVTLTFHAVAKDGNEHRFYVVVDPDNLVTEANEENNVAFQSLHPQETYDFEVFSSDFYLSADPVDIFKDLKITSKITNKGTMNAYAVQIRYFIDEAGAPFEIGMSTVNIPAGATITNEIIWKTNKAGIALPLTVFADPFNRFAEISEDNNKASIGLTVNGSTEANLTISYKDMVTTPNPAKEKGNANISVLVRNEGFASVENVQVYLYKGVPDVDGVLLGTRIVPSLNPGASSKVVFDWPDIPDAGERIIYARVDPSNQITEIRKDDNDAFVVLDILSLPDLAVSTNSIVFHPAAPKEGDTVFIDVTVKNLGRQSASNVLLKAVDGNTVIGTRTILLIAGNSQETLSFSYDATGKEGPHQITVIVDPDNLIAEQSDENNSASRPFGVQNVDLWLTEPYISPNSDGIKDNTQLFFRLAALQTVKVIVTNAKGEAVRTFNGAEFANVDAGNIAWDGRNDNGMIVADGQYLIKVLEANNGVLGSLLVVLDNNRSPLTEALDTKYLLNNNLTCMLPDINYNNGAWQWFPNESGIVFSTYYSNANTPEYPSGIYTIAPDGQDILRLVPPDWTDSGPDFYYLNYQAYPSPNGEKIAFTFWKYDNQSNRSTIELWMVDPDGKHLTSIASMNYNYNDRFYSVKWSPDSNYMSYVALSGGNFDLWITNAATLEKNMINSNVWSYDEREMDWSPDSTKIAYQAGYYNQQNNNYDYNLMVSDPLGNKKVISDQFGGTLQWLDNEIIISGRLYNYNGEIWLVDTGENGDHRLISASYENLTISPAGRSFAFTTRVNDTMVMHISDNLGNTDVIYEPESSGPSFEYRLGSIIWTEDGSKIAFLETENNKYDTYCEGPQYSGMHLVIYDFETREKKVITLPLSVPQCYPIKLDGWLADGLSIIYDNDGIFVLNSDSGSSVKFSEYSDGITISPLERYITYFKSVELSSVCYGRGWTDLWSMSSLLNLTADLRPLKNKSAVVLKGIAADLNFEGYQIEYADTKSPEQWNLVQPPSNVPVINDLFATWVPPYEGTFYLRLTVWDKAGNAATDRKRVSWGLSSSITNLYKSAEIFSPNGDGVKDTLSLNYTVLEPVHLEFSIYDENNRLIRTFLKDHAAPGADYIVWDGRDDNVKVLPDGKYTIKIFDFEFFVELDNTPPDVNLELSSINQYLERPDMGPGIMPLVVFMRGHAYDKNLKKWKIEYGEGNSPEIWHEDSVGAFPLSEKDKYGNSIIDPVKDIEIRQYLNENISALTAKRFRITVDDFAGNRRTVMSNMLEEQMLLYFHSWGKPNTSAHEYFKVFKAEEYQALALPQEHILNGIETIKSSLTDINLQYWSDFQWHDAVQKNYSSDGVIDLAWDRNKVLSEVGAVRIKAVDESGQLHYSNIVMTKSSFFIDRCAPQTNAARNYLFEKLSLLRFQIQSAQDMRYEQWTDYATFNAPDVPTGSFSLAPLPDTMPGKEYRFRMVGIGESGREYIGTEGSSACEQLEPLELKLSVKNYTDADCGMLSDGKSGLIAGLSKNSLTQPITLRTLSYYIQSNGGLQLLRQLDLTKDQWAGVVLETSAMSEGSYPISAVLNYFDTNDYKDKELSAADALIVDRTLPEARITYPDKSLTVCPVKRSDEKGDWFVLPVEGVALDNTAVNRYELYYGYGEEPAEWEPALKRIIKNNTVEFVPITGGSVKGKLEDWYVEGIYGTVSLKLKVIDRAGNVTCYTTSFTVKDVVEIDGLSPDKYLFSPNVDGLFDEVNVSYEINEYASVDLKVYPLTRNGDNYLLGQSPVWTIASEIDHIGGEGYASWDGMTDAGMAPDGYYGMTVNATDACGNTRTRWTPVEVDNTPPISVISYPGPGDIVGNIIEVRGTVADSHFRSYLLEAAPVGSTTEWRLIADKVTPVMNDILGTWNTYGLNGLWTLRLTSSDTVDNKTETSVDIDLGSRKNLIKDLNVTPKIFSPNNDGKLDSAAVKYEITAACDITIEFIDSGGATRKLYTGSVPSPGIYSYSWDGKDNAGATVSEGAYTVKLTAALAGNPSVNQAETATVVVDIKTPTIDIKQPQNNSFIKSSVTVHGTVTDSNIAEYSISYAGDTGITLLDAANQNRENYVFGVISELPEGKYTLSAQSKDLGENISESGIVFTIDRTPPKVSLDTPKTGEYYGSGKNRVSITGSVVEKNIEAYSLQYGAGDNPLLWTDLLTATELPNTSQLFLWNVGKSDGIPDGLYTLSLSAKDKAGLTGETRTKVTIDNTLPEVFLTSPAEGSYVRAVHDIKGTAYDANLDRYTLEFSEGDCDTAFKWAPLKHAAAPVTDGVLSSWQALPYDGKYCLRLAAVDKLGNLSEAKVNVTIDTHPPAPPVLSGKAENRSDIRLIWPQNAEPDIAGYDLYRDSRKINAALIKGPSYLDQNREEGVYIYTLKAIDLAGNESLPSNDVKIRVDLTGPDVRIRLPLNSSRVSGLVDIQGTAYSTGDFKQYKVYIGRSSASSDWNLIKTSPLSEPYGLLAKWDTNGLSEGLYAIKLEAEDLSGNSTTYQIITTVDNTPPMTLVLISAVPNGSDVTLTWQGNTDEDLAGYLLYRNDQLVNVSGIVMGNLKPYLISGTSYIDNSLNDGKIRYYLFAMDQAGNLSGQSNAVEVTIDTHAPHAIIVDPADGSKFDAKIIVKAESPDLDIAEIHFQYKKADDEAWANLGTPLTRQPYITYLDPIGLGLTKGDYHLRAVAEDRGGRTDSAPSYVTITYSDITAPSQVQHLRTLTIGSDVTLSWTANSEADLDGYNIYIAEEGSKIKINNAVIKENSYIDPNLSARIHTYEVTAIDRYGNEGKPSNSVPARVYAPVIEQPYTPQERSSVNIRGNNAAAGSSVEIVIDSGSGPEAQGTTLADADGRFSLDIALRSGENKITAKAVDKEGNVSRQSDLVVVVFNEPPAAPTGLQAAINGSDVTLTWDPNTEADLAGYNLYRNGEKLNLASIENTGVASAYYSYYSPARAIDSNTSTYWMSDLAYSDEWLELDLAAPELINHLEINWLNDEYSARDYEIQFWSGYSWITQEKISENTTSLNIFDVKPSYRTERIRIRISDTNNQDYHRYVAISEVRILKDKLITVSPFNDPGLIHGTYAYKITAVDKYGFESLPSDIITAGVGDVLAPSSPSDLIAAASDSDIFLNWTPNSEADLAGYNVYRNTAQGWAKLNTSLIGEAAFTDALLKNGAYTYRVSAVDQTGNESQPSNESTATINIPDMTPPSKPVIFLPTVAALPVLLDKDHTDISGFAEPDTTVELYRNGVSAGITNAAGTDAITQHEMEPDAYVYTSPDGKQIFYDLNNTLWLKAIDAGTATLIAENAYGAGWSPAGDKFAFYAYDSNWRSRLRIFELESGITKTLTDDTATDEYLLSWAPDGKSLAFGSNRSGRDDVWFKNFSSGSLTQFSYDSDIFSLKFSPDGKKVAYFIGANLYVRNLSNENIALVDEQTDSFSIDWSPDGKALSFISYRDSSGDLYTYAMDTQAVTQITHVGSSDISWHVWTFDGSKILLLMNDSINGTTSIVIVSPQQGQVTTIREQLYLYGFDRLTTGGIAFKDNKLLNVLDFKGHFSFRNVLLDKGENLLFVTSKDATGNASQPSDEISVTFDAGQLPDIEILTDDIYVYPTVPVEGQQLSMNIVVWNKGQSEANDVAADVYIQDATGNLERIKSVSIPLLEPGAGEIIGVSWNTSGKKGANKIFAVLDPADMIPEQREDNNTAEKDFFVVTGEGVYLVAALNAGQLTSGQNAGIDMTVINGGIGREISLDVAIEDGNGYVVAILDSRNIHLEYGSQKHYAYSWNTGSTYAGVYSLHAIARDASGILAEKILLFTILPNIALEAAVVTDKSIYGPHENVQVTYSLKNDGLNYLIPELHIKNVIADAAGTELFSEDRNIIDLLPGSNASYQVIWDTGLSAPGNYIAAISISDNEQVILSRTTTFNIESVVSATGSLQVAPSPVLLGDALQTDYALMNTGNSDAMGLVVRVVIEDLETQDVLKSFEVAADLRLNNSGSGRFIFSTQGLGLKTYTAALQYLYQSETKTLARSLFTVKDGIPPAVTISSPVSGGLYNAAFDISAMTTDDASGVDRVEFQADSGSWRVLPTADYASGRYSTTWIPVNVDEGPHTLNIRATDRACNAGAVSAIAFIIDMTPPELLVSTLSDGSWTNSELLNIAGKITDNFGIQSIIINGMAVDINSDGTFTYPLPLLEGANVITITVKDLAGNKTTDSRVIILDRNAPVMNINTPVDNMKTKTAQIELTGTVDEQSTVMVSVNGYSPVPAVMDGNSFRLLIMPDYGINTIQATATDRADNTSSVKSTVIFDDRNPVLSVIDPAQDLKTNLVDMILKGEVEDITAIAVRVAFDGKSYFPAVAGGRFEQPITFDAEKTYQISVTATDEVGNETTVQRNVIYDATPPLLTLDSLPSFSNQVSQVVTGSSEAGAIVSIICPTAAVGVVSYPTPETWEVLLSNMAEGSHVIEVMAADEIGNISQTITNEIIIDLTAPLVTIAAPVNGTLYGGKVEIAAIATDSGSGVESAEYQIDGGIWQPLAATEPGTNTYSAVWMPELADEGTHAISVRATDQLGFVSIPVSVAITIDLLSGNVKATPDPVSSGLEEKLSFNITNSSSGDISGLAAMILILDPDTGETKQTYTSTILILAGTAFSSSVNALTGDLSPKRYDVILQVAGAGLPANKELSRTSFEVKASQLLNGVEIEKTIPDVRNVLIWINDGCPVSNEEFSSPQFAAGEGHLSANFGSKEESDRCHENERDGLRINDLNTHDKDAEDWHSSGIRNECKNCVRYDLVERVLRESGMIHLMVHSAKDFRQELRNPYFTDIVILGDYYALETESWEELREKVYAGTGLVSSLLMWREADDQNEADDLMLGVMQRGRLPGKTHEVHFDNSPIAGKDSMESKGKAERVKAIPGTTIAGWLSTAGCKERYSRLNHRPDEHHNQRQEAACGEPAIVLNKYGKGKTIFHAFDIGRTIDDDNYLQLAALLRNSLSYVHTVSDGSAIGPGSLIPIEISLNSFDSPFDLILTESYPAAVRLFDPVTGAWISDQPWINRKHLGGNEAVSLLYYALIPDMAGTYTFKTDVAYLENGTYRPYKSVSHAIDVAKDLKASAGDVLRMIDGLDLGHNANMRRAKKILQLMTQRETTTKQGIENNIRSVLSAIRLVLSTASNPSDARAMMDEILYGLESKYYFTD